MIYCTERADAPNALSLIILLSLSSSWVGGTTSAAAHIARVNSDDRDDRIYLIS